MSFHSQWRTSAYLILTHLFLSLVLNQLFYHVDFQTLFKIILIPIVLFDVMSLGFFFMKRSVPVTHHSSLFSGGAKFIGLLIWASALFFEFILFEQTYPIITYVVLAVGVLSSHKSFAIPEVNPKKLFASELTFLIGFHLMLVSLSFFPEIFSGEKAMDASFLGQYMRHTGGELFDPWFSMKPMGYYSFGYFVWAHFLKVFEIPLKFAYPISLSLVGAFCLQILYSIFSLYQRDLKKTWFTVVGALTCFSLPPLIAGYESIGLPQSFGRFWASTRIYPKGFFSEYPFWSLSFADLHPHVMNYPVILTFLFLLLLYYERERIYYSIEQIAAIGLVWGCLCMTNMWDTLFIAIFLLPVMIWFAFKNKGGLFALVLSGLFALELFFVARYQMGINVPKTFAIDVLKANFLLPTFLQSGWLILLTFLLAFTSKKGKFISLLNLGLLLILILSLNSFAMDHLNTIFKSHTFVFLIASCLFIIMIIKSKKEKVLLLLFPITLIVSGFSLYHREAGRADLRNRVGLDAVRYIDAVSKADYEIVRFLNTNVKGTPLLIEFPGRTFVHGTPRISMLTGLPIYLGWDFHVQLRGASVAQIEQRKKQLRDFYQTKDPIQAHSWARENSIKYVVISDKEYTHYNSIHIDVFDNYPALFKPLVSVGRSRLFEIL